MISRIELQRRVEDRRQKLEAESLRFSEIVARIKDFVSDIKDRPMIYGLLKSLSVWKELEKLSGIDPE